MEELPKFNENCAQASSSLSEEEECRARVAPFIDHIRTALCSGNEQLLTDMLRFFAHSIQRPNDDFIDVCLLLRGSGRVGKSLIVKTVGSLHGPHFVHLTGGAGVDPLKGDPVLLFVDDDTCEASWLSELGIRKNPTHLVLASNKRDIIPEAQRRFLVVDVNDAFSADQQYYAALAELFATTEFRNALFHYLNHHVDLTDYQPCKQFAEEESSSSNEF